MWYLPRCLKCKCRNPREGLYASTGAATNRKETREREPTAYIEAVRITECALSPGKKNQWSIENGRKEDKPGEQEGKENPGGAEGQEIPKQKKTK